MGVPDRDTIYARAVLCGMELKEYNTPDTYYFVYDGIAYGWYGDKLSAAIAYLRIIRMHPDAEIKKEDDYPAGN